MKIIVTPLLLCMSLGGAQAQTAQEFAWIGRNRDALKEKLRDPSGAEFRNETVSRKSGSPVVCGEVNARNGFGGRNGYQRWIGAIPVGVYLEQEISGFSKVWASLCGGPTGSSSSTGHLPLAR